MFLLVMIDQTSGKSPFYYNLGSVLIYKTKEARIFAVYVFEKKI